MPENPDCDFNRRSETESICTYCYATVRSQDADLLHLEESLHVLACFSRPNRKEAPDVHTYMRTPEGLLAASRLAIQASKETVEQTKRLIAQSRESLHLPTGQ